jgi:tRNA threonylcarbamoyladenosine biosynthesis protein TsaB
MRVLALDTTTRAGSVAVADGGRLVVERAGDPSRTHAVRLPGEILDALEQAGLASGDIDLFAVAAGPGSFTGLRIGIATIQGFAFVHRKPVAPISALRALGEVAAAQAIPGARIAAWMDAHRRDVFSALYQVSAPDEDRAAGDATANLLELEAPSVGTPSGTLARWTRLGLLPAAVAGDGAELYRDLLPGVPVIAPPPLAGVIARLASVAAAAGHTVGPDAAQPLYVRRPDAEIARDAAPARQ